MERLTLDEIEALPREYLTVKEVVSVMGISRHSFYKQRGKMPFTVLRVSRNYRIPKRPFIEYMRTGRSSGNG